MVINKHIVYNFSFLFIKKYTRNLWDEKILTIKLIFSLLRDKESCLFYLTKWWKIRIERINLCLTFILFFKEKNL